MMAQPKVTVVTPVYNGARFLAEAIDSVLSQTYSNWEYIIVDNSSTDDTLAIAERYAARDRRIKVHRATPHLPVIAHWNRALRLIPADAAYCKELHADDILFPNCLAEMVAFMEQRPRVSLVSSYIMYDNWVSNNGVPLKTDVLPGREVIRRTVLGGWLGSWYVFGCPSSVMIRMSALRALGEPAYDESLRHADVDLWYRLLEDNDFGFIHQVLSCERTHETSQTNTFTTRYSTLVLEHFCFLRHYGPKYADEQDYRRAHRLQLRHYRRRIARRLVGGAGLGYWRMHRKTLARFGYRLTAKDVAIGALVELGLWIVDMRHAARSVRKLASKIRRRTKSDASRHKRFAGTSRRSVADGLRRLLLSRHRILRRPFYRSLAGADVQSHGSP